MRDPFAWSVPLGRLFGIQIKVHLLFPLIILAVILRVAYDKEHPRPDGAWVDAALVMALLFLSVLLHEFGHCFAARAVDGDAQEVLLWPLGGLANVEVPQTPRAHFLVAAAGPAVNLALAGLAGVLLYFLPSVPLLPAWNPLPGYPGRFDPSLVALRGWDGGDHYFAAAGAVHALALFFWVNWFLALMNIVLVGFPLDGGRMLQAALWPRYGYRQATLAAVFAGFIVMFVLALYGLVMNEIMPICLGLFVYVACKNQWIILETGGEESLFGYDFSQGYTSLERDLPQATARPRRVGWFTRWRQKRTAQRLQREAETRVSEERRMDELLEKVQREGITALTDEERRFMKRVSDRYKNRH
jgi:Zn-dependent protease